ncbi:MAG: hypothetical protein CMJ13_07210 [Pelagibacterales bacterium]|nr:hypothetical protein [Pelagibacterales bacterium]|tara:strand:+ start:579 stop:2111 length:1533 start_codon:yes stop_codon:yes gene_type:complete
MIFRWIYLPPLLIYLSAGVSGLTSIVGVFFLKDYLNLSAAFIASIGFWAGIPWALKMPFGFIVDKYWSKKNYLVFFGAIIVFVSILIMYLLISDRKLMESYFSAEIWYILSALLTPIGYVIQDVVADALTVEAVESSNLKNVERKITKRSEHMLLQLYGRFSIILGSLLVGLLNIYFFSGIQDMQKKQVLDAYSNIYFLALFIPILSVSGVILASTFKKISELKIYTRPKNSKLDLKIFLVSICFVFLVISLGTIKFPFSQELILITSLILIFILMKYLVKSLSKKEKFTIIGTALIIFIYRAIPGPGQGLNWFEIDILGFDQSFMSYLSVNAAFITLMGLFFLKNLIIKISLANLFIFLSLISGLLYLPSLFMYYGGHNYTSILTGGLVDARFIAFVNTAVESPLGQVAMIPLLGWIAKNAPIKYKATFFAVFASFTNLALSARELFTKYLNKIFIIKREIIEQDSGIVLEKADYNSLDELLICLVMITILVPIVAILMIQKTKYKSMD